MIQNNPGLRGPYRRETIALVCVGFPEPTNTDECRKASPVAVWHSSSFQPPMADIGRSG